MEIQTGNGTDRMETGMSRRRTWGPDDRSDSREVQLLVRCEGNRWLGAGLLDGYLRLTRIFTATINGIHLVNDFTTLESVPLGPYQCPNHKDGHRMTRSVCATPSIG